MLVDCGSASLALCGCFIHKRGQHLNVGLVVADAGYPQFSFEFQVAPVLLASFFQPLSPFLKPRV